MKKDKHVTKVIFRNLKGQIIALFPEEPGDNSPYTCSSYMHVGQHGAASVSLSTIARLATPQEYKPLAKELEELGYRLQIIKRIPQGAWLKRWNQLNPQTRSKNNVN